MAKDKIFIQKVSSDSTYTTKKKHFILFNYFSFFISLSHNFPSSLSYLFLSSLLFFFFSASTSRTFTTYKLLPTNLRCLKQPPHLQISPWPKDHFALNHFRPKVKTALFTTISFCHFLTHAKVVCLNHCYKFRNGTFNFKFRSL